MSTKKLLIVGTGITGAISASLIKSVMNDVLIVMWDKAMKTGGRMNTTKSPSQPTCTVDLGAQYITRYPEFTKSHGRIYEELLEANILKPLDAPIEGMRPMPPGLLNYVTPNGINSLVQHFLEKTEAPIILDQRLNSLSLSKCGTKWSASSNTVTDVFDAVLLTMPVPQILQMKGDVEDLIDKDEKLKEKMKSVEYTSRFALALFYDKHLPYFDTLPWSAKYFTESDIVFVAVDNKKRGTGHLPSILAHTTCSFGAENLESNKDLVKEKVMATLRKSLPGLPAPNSITCHKWRYSQVRRPYPDSQGCLILNTKPFLICGGDSFVSSNFDGCIQTSKSVAREIVKYFTQLK